MSNKIEEKINKKLKSCPFCGHNAKLESYIIEAAIFCTNEKCRVTITRRHHKTKDEVAINNLIKTWNFRFEE